MAGHCRRNDDLYAYRLDKPWGACLIEEAAASRDPLLLRSQDHAAHADSFNARGADALLTWPFRCGRSTPMMTPWR